MVTRKVINISGTYVVHHAILCLFDICTLYSKNLKGRTESHFILFLKLNNHPTRCFNFGLLRRIHLNCCKFELNYRISKSKTKPF